MWVGILLLIFFSDKFQFHSYNIYLLKVNDRNTGNGCEMFSVNNKNFFSSVSFVDFEQVNVYRDDSLISDKLGRKHLPSKASEQDFRF